MRVYSNEPTRTITRQVRMVVGVKCDICGTIIDSKKYRSKESRYFEVTTGHNDWGHDSCESVEKRDVCPECIVKVMTEYINTASGTDYIEVETSHHHPYEETV